MNTPRQCQDDTGRRLRRQPLKRLSLRTPRRVVKMVFSVSMLLLLAALPAAAENARDYYTDGNEHRLAGQYITAEAELLRALALNPYYKEAHLALGQLYLDLQRDTEAVRSCSRAVSIDPDYADGRYWLGRALMALPDDTRAAAEFHAAVRLDPGRREALLYLARLELRAGRWTPALRQLAALEERYPDYAALYQLRAEVYQRQNRTVEALAAYARAWALDARQVETGLGYCRLLFAAGRFAAADSVARQVLALAPDNIAARQLLARSAIERGQPIPAETADFLAARTGVTEQYLLGYAALQRGDTAGALALLAAAVAADEDDPFARQLYERAALENYRTDHPARRELGGWRLLQARRAAERGDAILARYHFALAVQDDPQAASARFAYGRYLDRRGLTGLAQRQLDAAVDLDARSALYRDCAQEARYRAARSLAVRQGLTAPPAPAPVRVALFLYGEVLDDYSRPGAPELLAEQLGRMLTQLPQVTIVVPGGAEHELTLAEAEAQAAAAGAAVVVHLRVRQGADEGSLEGVCVVVPDGRRVLPVRMAGRGPRWADLLCRQVRAVIERALPLTGEVVRLDEREVLVNLGLTHGLAKGDRLLAGEQRIALTVQEADEGVARCVPVRRRDLEQLRRHEPVTRLPAPPAVTERAGTTR